MNKNPPAFPENFTWGVSTSSHQIEGHTSNDWSVWEVANAGRLAREAPQHFAAKSPVWDQVKAEAIDPQNYISGPSDDSYNRWQQDIELISGLGLNAYRFSIEWSRVEPERDHFDPEALQHYSDMINLLRTRGIEPFVTILHRAIPIWVADQGGWANYKTVEAFGGYVDELVKQFGDRVKFWMPLNEPVLNVGGGFAAGLIPPGRKNIFAALRAYRNMIAAHNVAYDIIHTTNRGNAVGTAHAAVYAEPYNNRWYNKLIVNIIHYLANWKFLNGVRHKADFMGIQYYTRGVVALKFKYGIIPSIQNLPQPGPASDMGQEIYPRGLYKFIQFVWKRYKKPVYVTENGIADRNDSYRAQYISDHIAEVKRAIDRGMDVRGYFYWSLLDNFEWDKGFWPNFGLYAVDRVTFERKRRPNAKVYADIIKDSQRT
jgi:beta-glucosidase